MLDLRFLVENRARVEEMLARRGSSLAVALPAGLDPWALDAERRQCLLQVDSQRHRQRTNGEEIARLGRAKQDASALKAEMKSVSDEVKRLEARLGEVESSLRDAQLVIPNVPDDAVPVGADAFLSFPPFIKYKNGSFGKQIASFPSSP